MKKLGRLTQYLLYILYPNVRRSNCCEQIDAANMGVTILTHDTPLFRPYVFQPISYRMQLKRPIRQKHIENVFVLFWEISFRKLGNQWKIIELPLEGLSYSFIAVKVNCTKTASLRLGFGYFSNGLKFQGFRLLMMTSLNPRDAQSINMLHSRNKPSIHKNMMFHNSFQQHQCRWSQCYPMYHFSYFETQTAASSYSSQQRLLQLVSLLK